MDLLAQEGQASPCRASPTRQAFVQSMQNAARHHDAGARRRALWTA
ncbi:MAG: hypothetical protein WKG07_33970 [Hymenobacter sp.]